MNFRQIEAFRAVMTSGSTKNAAGLLGVSQPAVSRLIAQLERATRFALFDRSQGRLKPTPEAHLFLDVVNEAFGALDRVERRAQDIRDGQSGALKLAVMPALALGFLPAVLKDFARDQPDTLVTLHIPPSERIEEWAVSQQIDIGIVADPNPHVGVEIEPFCLERYALAMPAGHRLAGRQLVTPPDLAGERIIAFHGALRMRRLLEEAFRLHGLEPHVAVETQYSAAIAAMVAQGIGVGLIDPFTARDFSERGVVAVPFEPAIPFDVGVLYPSHRALSRAARRLIAILRTHRAHVLGSREASATPTP